MIPIPENSCVIRLSALGDVILTTGVLLHWHQLFGTQFRFVTRQQFVPVLENHPALASVVGLGQKDIATWHKTARTLARNNRGLPLIDLHGNGRTILLRFLWTGPTRSYGKMSLYRRLFQRTRRSFFAHRLQQTNVPQRYALALDQVPPDPAQVRPRIFLSSEEKDAARRTLSRLDITSGFVLLHPYATHPAKRWPDNCWKDLASRLDQAGVPWIVIGRSSTPLFPGDRRDLTNRTTLRETCGLIAAGACMVTNDSGPMHLATAVQTPVLALFGPTSREWGFHPSGPADRVLSLDLDCAPCSLHGRIECSRNYACMQTLDPDIVSNELETILQGRRT